jgi:2-amino-4-hydroxy-6-hydroxymethyldihydropteridine diphosphokinase
MTSVYLSLGGNEGSVLSCLKHALKLLSLQKQFIELKVSNFYLTAPVGVESQTWFINAVCSFRTSLSPQEIFEIVKKIEGLLGKIDKPKDASRPIDIDFLFYGDQILKEPDLEIPHPRWKERLFVLIPLADLTNEIMIRREESIEKYILKDLIQNLQILNTQPISLLEKNPGLQ